MAFVKWFAQPAIAVVFGVFMLCAETCDHFDAIARLDWRNMPLHDWTAACLLVAVWFVRRRDFQAIAWAFMLSLLFGAFFGHFAEWLSPTAPDGWIPERIVFPNVVLLNVTALCALAGTLTTRD